METSGREKSTATNQRCSKAYVGNPRKLEVFKMEEKHFFVVHTFISDETRRAILTPPEKRNPPQKTKTEKEWGESHDGPYARCMQTWLTNEEFFYCHRVAKSEQDVHRQLEHEKLNELVNSMVEEVHEFLSVYRNTDQLRNYPENGMYW